MHAAIDYAMAHKPSEWWSSSNTLVVLEVDNEQELLTLESEASKKGIKLSLFREPALGMQATALALDPLNDEARLLTKKLKLALGS